MKPRIGPISEWGTAEREEAKRRLTARAKPGQLMECWPCSGKPNRKGYGCINVRQQPFLAHRLAFQLHWGVVLPIQIQVCHDCPGGDNPVCCNPEHLCIGDAKWHAEDRGAKGQTPTGERHWTRFHPERLARGERHGSKTCPERVARGERHSASMREAVARGKKHGSQTKPECVARGETVGGSKLTELQVLDVMVRYLQGALQREIANAFGVDQSVISNIVNGKTWKHVFE